MSNIVNLTRPASFDEVVGMETVKTILLMEIRGAKNRGLSPRSFVLGGPPGTGKTTIAELIGAEMGGQVHKYLGSDLKSPDDIYDIAAQVQNNDVVYIEEAHTIGGGTKNAKYTQAVFLEWIENGKFLNAGPFNVTAPQVSFVLPTTSPGRLSEPLRTRCRILSTKYYTIDQLEEILRRAARKIGIDVESCPEALRLLAQSSRGSPRIAVMNRLDGLANLLSVEGVPFSMEAVKRFLDLYDISEWGLESSDIHYCRTLYNKMQGSDRPVALKTMQQLTGMSEDMVREVIEPYLMQIGVLSIETRGRILTEFGCKLLDLEVVRPGTTSIEKLVLEQRPAVDVEILREMIKDPNVRKAGLRGLSEKFGLNYPKDNGILQSALNILGFESRQRIGIAPLRQKD